MPSSARVRPGHMVISVGLEDWKRGFRHLEKENVSRVAVEKWSLAVEVLFAATQQYAHVLSGDMISTGRHKTGREGTDIVGEIEYGGIPGEATGEMVDYTEYELKRKGSHDFYARAARATKDRLEAGVGEMLEAAFSEAFRR